MDILERNFFTDREILQDPAALLRRVARAWPGMARAALRRVILSGIEEILGVYADANTSRRSFHRSVRW